MWFVIRESDFSIEGVPISRNCGKKYQIRRKQMTKVDNVVQEI